MRESVLLLVVEKQVRELRRALPSLIMPLFLYAGDLLTNALDQRQATWAGEGPST